MLWLQVVAQSSGRIDREMEHCPLLHQRTPPSPSDMELEGCQWVRRLHWMWTRWLSWHQISAQSIHTVGWQGTFVANWGSGNCHYQLWVSPHTERHRSFHLHSVWSLHYNYSWSSPVRWHTLAHTLLCWWRIHWRLKYNSDVHTSHYIASE